MHLGSAHGKVSMAKYHHITQLKKNTTPLGLKKVWNKHMATGLYRRIPSACQQTGRTETNQYCSNYGAQVHICMVQA